MLAISFGIIFTCKKTGDEYKNRYGKKDCPDHYEKYTKNGEGKEKLNNETYKAFYDLAERENFIIRE